MRVTPIPASPAAIATAAALLSSGRLVAFPTETVYGLGADAGNDAAVARIFAAKGRPRFNPLIVHVADVGRAERFARLDDRARALVERFWPGPLTLVLPRRPDAGLSLLVSAGLDTIALRAPDHPLAQALLRASGLPIAAPSANPSGAVSPTTAAHVAADLAARVDLILDGGPCRIGVESTILDLSGPEPVVLRTGGVPAEALADVLGPVATRAEGPVRAPGMLPRHYAPRRPLRLNALTALPGELLLGFGRDSAGATLTLSAAGDVVEAAANLFAMLRALDSAEGGERIAVAPIPDHGLGAAINDRLRRAAAPAEPKGSGAAGESAVDFDRGPAMPCVLPDVGDEQS